MKSALQAMGVWRIIIGDRVQPSPDNSADLERYHEQWDKAAGTLKLKVEHGQETHYQGYEDNPKEIWIRLEAAHVSKKPAMRFNAYSDLFSIRKRSDESLNSLMIRIDQAMQQIRDLRPKAFTLSDLEDELHSMAMISSLPAEYDSFRSSLMLLDQIDKKTLQETFRNEEINRIRSQNEVSSSVSSKALVSSSAQAVVCDFCSYSGHTLSQCYKYLAAQKKAQEEAQARKSRSKSQKARKAQEESPVPAEFAGNASRLLAGAQSHANHADWNADTGATSIMTPHRHWMHNYTPKRVPVKLADETIIYSAGIGSVYFEPEIGGRKTELIEFTRVLHVPQLGNNLLAVLYLTRNCGYIVNIDDTTMHFVRGKQTVFTATINDQNAAFLNGTTLTASLK